SNASILKVEGDRHPIHLYLENGIPVTLNTDDEGVSRSNLTNEYVRAVRSYGFDYRQLKTFARNALEYSFLPGEGLYRGSYDALRPGFERVRDEDWTPDLDAREAMAGSQKLAAQVRLERAFVAFEK
ncbi:MAG: adenosine deaminase, partial [Fimbriimonadaceae bacterium]|nr:adenosine deaminase [Fimbriimonadaceae bacterium]